MIPFRVQIQRSHHQGALMLQTAKRFHCSLQHPCHLPSKRHTSTQALDTGVDYFHTGEDTRLGGLTRNMQAAARARWMQGCAGV